MGIRPGQHIAQRRCAACAKAFLLQLCRSSQIFAASADRLDVPTACKRTETIHVVLTQLSRCRCRASNRRIDQFAPDLAKCGRDCRHHRKGYTNAITAEYSAAYTKRIKRRGKDDESDEVSAALGKNACGQRMWKERRTPGDIRPLADALSNEGDFDTPGFGAEALAPLLTGIRDS